MANKNELEVKIKIEGEQWKKCLDKALKEATKNVKIDGFRKGKAPKDTVIKKYGQGNIWIDAADLCVQDAYRQMLDEKKDLEIVARPDGTISAVNDDYVEFTFTLTLKPEVKLGKYKGLKIEKDKVKVTDKEIEDSLNSMRQRFAEVVTKDGQVEENDTVIIDFEGFKDGEPFEGGKSENYSLTIGSNTFIPGFEEQIIGMKKGEEKEIVVTFPDDYHAEELKGQPAIFKVKLHEIKETKLPELNEEFFEDLDYEGVKDEASLKKVLKDNILARKEREADNKYLDQLLDECIKNMEVDIPHIMIHEEIDRMLAQYEENLKMQGLTLEQFYQFTNSDEEALKDQMHEEAEKRVSIRLLLEAIIKEEKIEVTKEETEKELEELLKQYQMEKDDFLKAAGGLEMVEYDLKVKKAFDIIKGEE